MSQGLASDTQGIPQFVGRYEVLLPIASGGMATVYLARSVGVGGFEREVALKLTHSHLRENREFALDLVEEAKLSVRIRHPSVVSVLDAGEDPAGLFLVMDYVEGDTLASLLRASAARGAPLPAAIGLRIVIDVLSGLHAAHELRDDAGRPVGLVHRDFSPQNILVGVDGNARLSDFGIAKAATRLGHTTTGVVKGKLAYMSPEQARGQPLDRRSDIWAAGVVAWEVLTGTRLFDGENEAATLLKIVSERPPPVRSVNLDIPEELDRAVASALVIDRQQRCPNALTYARQIARAAQSHGLLADVEQVASCVDDLVSEKLERRRERIRSILAERSQRTPLAVSEDRRESALRETRVDHRAVPEDAAALRIEPEHSGIRTRHAESPPAPAPPPELETPFAKPRSPVPLMFVLGGIAALVLVALLLVRSRSTSQSAPSTLGSAPSGSASVASTEPSASAAPSNSSTVQALEFITLSVDVPVKSVVVEGRQIEVSPPSRTLGLQVPSEQVARGVLVEAVAVDGRVARVIAESGQHAVALRFATARNPGAMNTSTGTGTGKLPFAPSPYSTTGK